MSSRRSLAAVVAIVLSMVGIVVTTISTTLPRAAAAGTPAQLPTDNPANFTPNVLNGEVDSIYQIGTTVVITGTFTQVANATQNGGAAYARGGIAAFDAVTGVVSTAFAPVVDVNNITTVISAGDGTSIYVGGNFNTVDAVGRQGVARLNLADGSLVTAFDAGTINGSVRDLRLVGSELIVAGAFTHVAGSPRAAMAIVDATTGVLSARMNLGVTGTWNGGTTNVYHVDVTPNGGRLLMIGNFISVGGQTRNQIALVDLSTTPVTVSAWDTSFYTSTCAGAFDSYMRDLDISEDGTFAVITTTGAYVNGSSCDTDSRFELTGETAALAPTWVNYTGGDTSYGVEVHNGVAYLGGHMRWMNNPSAGDAPGQGAVPRTGMAALDVVTGLPFNWNPTRERGVGLFDYHVTAAGLWAGSDTDRFNNELRQRLAFFPWAGGTIVAADVVAALPNDVVLLGRTTGTMGTDASVLLRINAAGPTLASADDGPNWLADNSNPSPYRNNGSSISTSLTVGMLDNTVPSSDFDRPPASLWATERWDPAGGEEMAWNFPVTQGTPIQVRLYMGNKSSGTASPGQRVFDIDLDGVNVVNDIDLAASPGDNIGTMRAFNIVADADGVDIAFAHGVENPLINGIEIIRTDVSTTGPLGTQDEVQFVAFDGDTATAGPAIAGTVPWHTTRGAFTVDNRLYEMRADGTLVRHSINGTTIGAGIAVPTYANNIIADAATMTGIFYDPSVGRLYYTLSGSTSLYSRPFLPESSVIGAIRTTATGAVGALDPMRVRGMFLADGSIWFADSTTGALSSIAFAGGVVSGTPSVVNNTVDWRTRGMALSSIVIVPPTTSTSTVPPGTPTTTPGIAPTTTTTAPGGGITTTTSPTTPPTAPPGDNTGFTPVSPTRVFDTRPGGGDGALRDVAHTKVGGSNVLRVKFSALVGTTPASGVGAVSLNVAVTNPEAEGFVTVYPCGERELVANVNFVGGQTVSNAVIAPVSAAGDLCFYSLVPTDIVVDINGWLPAGSSFHAVSPRRVFDTRPNSSPNALRDVTRVKVGPNQLLSVSFANLTDVTPATGVGAVSLNLAATNPDAAGFITVFPCGMRKEVASANYLARQTVSNAVIAPVSTDGSICFYSLVPTDIVVDINGWFETGAGFVSAGPERVFDTRPGASPTALLDVARMQVSSTNVLRVRVTSLPGVTPASGVAAVSLNVTVTNPQASGFVTVFPCDTRREVANVNYDADQTIPNAVIAPVSGNGDVCFYSSAPADLVVDINGWFPIV